MDLSDIPHDEWDSSIFQFTAQHDCDDLSNTFPLMKGEIRELEPMYPSEITEMERLHLSSQIQSGSDDNDIWYNNDAIDMDMDTQSRNQLELVPQSSVPLALEYYPELSEALQGFEAPSDCSEFLLGTAHNEILQREESFGDNMLALKTFNPDPKAEGISVISSSTEPSPNVTLDPYRESLNSWLRQFTSVGTVTSSHEMHDRTAMSACEPGPSENNDQSGALEWAPFLFDENELSCLSVTKWVPPRAITGGCELDEMESVWVSNVEERESVMRTENRGRELEIENRKKGKQVDTRERAGRKEIPEERESEWRRRSERASKVPVRYMDEWPKSKHEKRRKTGPGRPPSQVESRSSEKAWNMYLVPRMLHST